MVGSQWRGLVYKWQQRRWLLGGRPDGHIHQWGTVTTDINNSIVAVTFPTAFTTSGSISVVVTAKSATDPHYLCYRRHGHDDWLHGRQQWLWWFCILDGRRGLRTTSEPSF